MAFDEEKHEALRRWAAKEGMPDPADLLVRVKGSGVQFRSARAAKSYRQVMKIFDEYMRDKNREKARAIRRDEQ